MAIAKKKVVKSASKPAVKETALAAATVKATRNRGKVLVLKTPAELRELVGADTPIPVSVKALTEIIAKAQNAAIRASL